MISDVDSYLAYFFVFEGQNNFMFQIPIDQIGFFLSVKFIYSEKATKFAKFPPYFCLYVL